MTANASSTKAATVTAYMPCPSISTRNGIRKRNLDWDIGAELSKKLARTDDGNQHAFGFPSTINARVAVAYDI